MEAELAKETATQETLARAKPEDLCAASRILDGRRLAHGTQFLITPAGKAVMNKAWAGEFVGCAVRAGHGDGGRRWRG